MVFGEQGVLFQDEYILKTDLKEACLICRSCKYLQRWKSNTKFFHYCGKRHSNRTNNGLLKVRCKDKACLSYDKVI